MKSYANEHVIIAVSRKNKYVDTSRQASPTRASHQAEAAVNLRGDMHSTVQVRLQKAKDTPMNVTIAPNIEKINELENAKDTHRE